MSGERRDLGEALFRLSRQVLEAEQLILDRQGLEMWDYAVLTMLGRGPARTQSELAATVGRDKTRLIPILDRLGAAGLVERTPDPADRRNRIVSITTEGRGRLRAARAAIRRMEADLLAGLPAGERTAFLSAVERLAWPEETL